MDHKSTSVETNVTNIIGRIERTNCKTFGHFFNVEHNSREGVKKRVFYGQADRKGGGGPRSQPDRKQM